MRSFCQTINYSSCNEDSLSEMKALRIREHDRVLCISGSGARTLDLLTAGPAEIVSVDFNPCQNFLLELKMGAIARLDYEEFVEFMGIRPSDQRTETYKRLRGGLSHAARNYWDRNLRSIRKGALYQGRWEKYFKKQAIFMGVLRPELLQALFAEYDLSRQARLWSEVWDSPEWRTFLRLVSCRAVWKYAFGDPGFYRYVPKGVSIYGYLQGKFDNASKKICFKDSPYAWMLFFGRFDGALPPYLRRESFENLKENLHRVRLATWSLGDFLEECEPDFFDKFSLSDFSSYANADEHARIWRGVLNSARSGARVCERQFLVKRELPVDVQPFVRREKVLERELEDTDNSMFFSFVVAELGGVGP